MVVTSVSEAAHIVSFASPWVSKQKIAHSLSAQGKRGKKKALQDLQTNILCLRPRFNSCYMYE